MITGRFDRDGLTLMTSSIDDSDYKTLGAIKMPDNDLTVHGEFTLSGRYNTEVEVVDQNNDTKDKVKTTVSMFNSDIMPDKVIYNGDTTILISGDDKYVVKCGKNDTFDPVFGFLYGYFLMNNGMSKTQAAKFFSNLEKCSLDDLPKVKRVANIMDDKSLTLDEYEKHMRKVLEEFIG